MRNLISILFLSTFVSPGELVWETDFSSADGYVDGDAVGQDDWVGQSGWVIDTTTNTATLTDPLVGIGRSSSVNLLIWDRLVLKAVVQMDFSKDINQTPLRLGFTSSLDDNDQPILLPLGNSQSGATVLACEFFRDGYPFLQTSGVAHHQGTVQFSPYQGAPAASTLSLTGIEADIYPHARMRAITAVNGDGASIDEIQTLSPVPLVDTPPLGGTDAYRLVLGDEETGDLFIHNTASNVQMALEALPSVGAGNVAVTGNATFGYVITFGGALAGVDLPQLKPIEPAVQDHVTQRFEVTYDLLKTGNSGVYEVKVSLTNLDTGAVFSGMTSELHDSHSYIDQSQYLSIRGGNFPEGGSITIESMSLERLPASDDQDQDGFTNAQEFAAGSDFEDFESTPVSETLVNTDFSTDALTLLNDSPAWRATDGWVVMEDAGAHVAQLDMGSGERAMAESAVILEAGDAAQMVLEFRFRPGMNFAIADGDLFELGLTDGSDPAMGGVKQGLSLSSTVTANGEWHLGDESLGSVTPFFDVSGYDDVTDEAVQQGATRTNGPSDWLRFTLVVVKDELTDSFTLHRRLNDLEGGSQESRTSTMTVSDPALWAATELRALFESFDSMLDGTLGGIEVRSFKLRKILGGDFDDDRLLNAEEFFEETSAGLVDTDGDNQADWFELQGGSDPLDENDFVMNIPLRIVTQEITINNRAQNNRVNMVVTGPPGMRVIMEKSSTLQPGSWVDVSFSPRTIDVFGDVILNEFTDIEDTGAAYFRVGESSL